MMSRRLLLATMVIAAAMSVPRQAPAAMDSPNGVDFEWYANVGRYEPAYIAPPTREGYIWSPSQWVWDDYGNRHHFVPGHWVADDYARQRAIYDDPGTREATAPMSRDDLAPRLATWGSAAPR